MTGPGPIPGIAESEDGMSEKRIPLHDGGFVSWEAKGQTVRGVFVGFKDSAQYPGKKIAVVQTEKGKEALATPTTLEAALQGVTTGTKVEIKFVGEDPPKKKGQSGLKRFEVYALTTDDE